MIAVSILRQIAAASSVGAALDLAPDDWRVTLIGPDAMGYHCSFVPPDAPPVALRMEERGFVPGKGETRLEAVHNAASWLLERMRKPAA